MRLKNVYLLFLLLVQSTFSTAALNPSLKTPNPAPEQRISRVFEGRLEKMNAFLAIFSKWNYTLYEKNKRIAFLEFKENVRAPKIADLFLQKHVLIRGIPKYVNKDPYLLIVVDDMCESE
ncbi:MAG: hypothetical protein LBF43_02370 [Puniceicoccales bacterium]|jgi:hypothetical protein|nr:hypothetical protein [Puniceicoccales bacterium]